jgi:DNA-binding transcriptional LysR family regulator
MDIRMLRNFVSLSKSLNFTRAAEEIAIVQPALSKQIQVIEQELGVLLFNRTNRKVALTDAGVYFAKECERLLYQFDIVSHKTAEIGKGKAGEIRIGHASTTMHTILPELMVKTQKELPLLRIILLEEGNRNIIEMLQKRELDLGFGPNIIKIDDVQSKTVYSENFVLILPENHSFDIHTFKNLGQFANEAFILPPMRAGIGYIESIHQMCKKYDFVPRVVHESANTSSVLRLVEAGMGITIEPKSSLKGYNLKVKVIELKTEAIKSEMQLLYLKERESELEGYLRVVGLG